MDEIEVPPYFLCPISLEMMKDPVTVSTGITYDRESIEKWIFSEKNYTCPVTKQALALDTDQLTPNHTLRRLIQSWCTLHASHGIQRFPTPKPPATKTQITKLLNDAVKSPNLQLKSLQQLRSIASSSHANKRAIEEAGAVNFLASLLTADAATREEAISILHHLQLSEAGLKSLSGHVDSLTRVMQTGSYESRAYAVMLLSSVSEVAEPIHLISLRAEVFIELVKLLRDQISTKATKSALQLMINVGPWGRNRIKAIDAGAAHALIDLLVDSTEKRGCEMALVALDQLCQCAEGRAELLSHSAGLAVVSKKILRVSKLGSERAVRVLYAVAKFCGTPSVLQEMLQLGIVAKLCLVLQVDCGSRIKERAREILKLHSRVWKDSPCIPITLLSTYPA
ncbi:Ubiquitin--protein ligase [Bertholletia excelsa]